MKTQYYAAASLNGFIATTDHGLDWLLQFGDPEDSSYPSFIAEVGAMAMGSATYLWLLRNLVHLEPDAPQPWPYEQPVWVFSSRKLPSVPGADIRFVEGDVRPVHQQMAAAADGKNIWLVGGGELVGQFHDHGLLDELIIQVSSVLLEAGMPLLPRNIVDPPLRLLSATTFGESFAELRYAVPRRQP
ncbi:MAG: dihydrofolate reductase family protein [Anaerolineae bacterium]|nr:dihydrofolate reductase family protein [Ardenticatenia bacterium]